jgi:hypothetical protein
MKNIKQKLERNVVITEQDVATFQKHRFSYLKVKEKLESLPFEQEGVICCAYIKMI